jgi:cytochrome P450 family 135
VGDYLSRGGCWTMKRRLSRGATAGLPPGPRLPRAVQTYLMFRRSDWFARTCQRRYGKTFTVRAFPWGITVVVTDPDAIQTVFTGDPDVWRAGEGYELLAPLLGRRSVIVLDGDEHLRVRKHLLPPFHGAAVRRHEAVIEQVVAEETARWPIGAPFRLLERMHAITLAVMLRAVIGAKEGEDVALLRETLRRGVEFEPMMMLMWLLPQLQRVGPWRRYNNELEQGRALLREEIARRRTDPRLEDRADVLSVLVRSAELDDDEVLDQLMTLLLAGHDTTATALAWALERLVRHPRALAHARADDDYLDAAITESLRLRPVLPAVVRRLARDSELAGYGLPAGTTVMANIRLAHLSPELYPEPESFRPERFLHRRGSTYGWIPFGGGTRRCLGAAFARLQMRVALRTILDTTELRPDQSAPEALRSNDITLIPARGARVVRRPHPAGVSTGCPVQSSGQGPAKVHDGEDGLDDRPEAVDHDCLDGTSELLLGLGRGEVKARDTRDDTGMYWALGQAPSRSQCLGSDLA